MWRLLLLGFIYTDYYKFGILGKSVDSYLFNFLITISLALGLIFGLAYGEYFLSNMLKSKVKGVFPSYLDYTRVHWLFIALPWVWGTQILLAKLLYKHYKKEIYSRLARQSAHTFLIKSNQDYCDIMFNGKRPCSYLKRVK